MTQAQRLHAAQLLDGLRRNTLGVLQEFAVTTSGPGGADTVPVTTAVTDHGGRVRVMARATLTGLHGAPGDSVADFDCYWTPMRPATMPTAQRKAGTTRRSSIGGLIDLWFTPQLSGCTVLIADFGNSVAMVHLQPYGTAQYSRLWIRPLWSVEEWRDTFREDNRSEMKAVISATGATPTRYTLVETLGIGNHVTVMGSRSDNKWRFYVQQSNGATVVSARRLAWTAWNAWVPWQPAAI